MDPTRPTGHGQNGLRQSSEKSQNEQKWQKNMRMCLLYIANKHSFMPNIFPSSFIHKDSVLPNYVQVF